MGLGGGLPRKEGMCIANSGSVVDPPSPAPEPPPPPPALPSASAAFAADPNAMSKLRDSSSQSTSWRTPACIPEVLTSPTNTVSSPVSPSSSPSPPPPPAPPPPPTLPPPPLVTPPPPPPPPVSSSSSSSSSPELNASSTGSPLSPDAGVAASASLPPPLLPCFATLPPLHAL